MTNSKVTLKLKNFSQLQKEIKSLNKEKASVGWFDADSAYKVLENEQGADNRPVRSALTMPLETKTDVIKKEIFDYMHEMISGKKRMFDAEKGLNILGKTGVDIILDAFDTQGYGKWKDNAPYTVDKKGFNRPMFETDATYESTDYKVR